MASPSAATAEVMASTATDAAAKPWKVIGLGSALNGSNSLGWNVASYVMPPIFSPVIDVMVKSVPPTKLTIGSAWAAEARAHSSAHAAIPTVLDNGRPVHRPSPEPLARFRFVITDRLLAL